ncbi:MAG: hypothetical protein PHO66_02725 [Eubacteriales bacterium]|nr:hypothetical protein [Eubacteriales bacterium]
MESGQLPVKLQVTNTAAQQAQQFLSVAQGMIKAGTATEDNLRVLYTRFPALAAMDKYAQSTAMAALDTDTNKDPFSAFLETGSFDVKTEDNSPAKMDVLKQYGYADGTGFVGLLESAQNAIGQRPAQGQANARPTASAPAQAENGSQAGQGVSQIDSYRTEMEKIRTEWLNPDGSTKVATPEMQGKYGSALVSQRQAAAERYKQLEQQIAQYERYEQPYQKALIEITKGEHADVIAKGAEDSANVLTKYLQYRGMTPEQIKDASVKKDTSLKTAWMSPETRMAAANDLPQRFGINYLTNEDIATINYFYGLGDRKRAEAMAKYVLDKGAAEYTRQVAAQNAQSFTIQEGNNALVRSAKHAGAGFGSIATGLISQPMVQAEVIGQAVENALTGENLPAPETQTTLLARTSTAQRQKVSEGMGPGGKLVTEVVMSAAEQLPSYAINIAAPGAGLALQSMRAGGSTAIEAKDAGATGWQQLGLTAGSTAIEYFTEKLPMEKFADLVSGKAMAGAGKKAWTAAVRGVLEQAGIEGTEEIISEYANTLMDIKMMGPKSAYQTYIDNLIAGGASEEAATRQANVQFFVAQPAEAGLIGGLTGGLMGGVGTGINRITGAQNNSTNQAQTVNNIKLVPPERVINTATGTEFETLPKVENVGSARTEYTPQEVKSKNWDSEHLRSTVATGAQSVKDFFLRSLNANKKENLFLGKVSESAGMAIENLTGINVTEYDYVFPSDAARHVNRRHGTNETQGNEVVVDADSFALIDSVTKEPDAIYESGEMNSGQNKSVTFTKRVGGVAIYAQYIQTGRRRLVGKTFRINAGEGEIVKNSAGNNQFLDEKKIKRLSIAPDDDAVTASSGPYVHVQNDYGIAASSINSIAQENKSMQEKSEEVQLDTRTILKNTYADSVQPEAEAQRTTDLTRIGLAEMEQAGASDRRTGEYIRRKTKAVKTQLVDVLGINKYASTERANESIARLYYEAHNNNGKIAAKVRDEVFDQLYQDGVVINDDFYRQYKDLKQYLRGTTIQAGGFLEDVGGIEFIRRNFGNIRVSKENGVAVDRLYQELNTAYPDLFPVSIENSAEQLERIADVARSIRPQESSIEAEYGYDAKAYMKQEFDRVVDGYEDAVRRFTRLVNASATGQEDAAEDATPAEVVQTGLNAKKAERELNSLQRKHKLLPRESFLLQGLKNGTLTADDLTGIDAETKAAIVRMAELNTEIKAAEVQRASLAARNRSGAVAAAAQVVKDNGKFKAYKGSLALELRTPERVARRVMGEKTGNRFVELFIRPIQKSAAARNRFVVATRNEIAALKLTQSESRMVQLAGEKKIVATELENLNAGRIIRASKGQTVENLTESERMFADLLIAGAIKPADLRQKYDSARIIDAVELFRDTYNDLIWQINDVRVKWGYAPIEKRADYFPHFDAVMGDSFLTNLLGAFGIDMMDEGLRTDLTGRTETFRPGIKYFANLEHRTGDKTDYDALRGMDIYLNTASMVIYHTENIQRLRVFENALRYEWTDEAVRAKADDIMAQDIAYEAKQKAVADLLQESEIGGQQGAFAVWINEYTNALAGKKSFHDRAGEKSAGRNLWFKASKVLLNRVGANMVAVNVGTWGSQLAPLAQALPEVDTDSSMRALVDTMKAWSRDDGFSGRSDFLSARVSSEQLSRSRFKKLEDFLSSPMEIVDLFSSEVVTRARYLYNMKAGMSADAALNEADVFARSVIGGRAEGDMPTIFRAQSPLIKAVTQFQLEQMNQFERVLSDMPVEMRKRGAKYAAATVTKYVIAAHLFNLAAQFVLGREILPDIIEILRDAWEKIADEDGVTTKEIKDFGLSLVDQVPFVGGLIGGAMKGESVAGRLVPVSAAFQGVNNLWKLIERAADNDGETLTAKEAWNYAYKGVSGPLYYIAFPLGGGQVKKTVEGISAVARGGAYSQTAGGERLQYPIAQTAGNYARAAVFGKSSLPETREYYDESKKALSTRQTEYYERAVNAGVAGDVFYSLAQEIKGIQPGKYSDGTTIPLSKGRKTKVAIDKHKDLTLAQKKILYEAFDVPGSLWKGAE